MGLAVVVLDVDTPDSSVAAEDHNQEDIVPVAEEDTLAVARWISFLLRWMSLSWGGTLALPVAWTILTRQRVIGRYLVVPGAGALGSLDSKTDPITDLA